MLGYFLYVRQFSTCFCEMGLKFHSFLNLKCWIFLALCLGVCCGGPEVSVKFLKTPSPFSNSNSATFGFQVLVSDTGSFCSDCSTICKLDHGIFSACNSEKESYTGLQDGLHSFEVCTSGYPHGAACASYYWTIG